MIYLKKFIIICSNNDIYKIEALSQERIKNILDKVLQEIIDNGYFEKGDSTNFIHEYDFYINSQQLHASNFICYDWLKKEVWFKYKIMTLDDWYFQDKIILNGDEDDVCIGDSRDRWSED